MQFEYCDWLAAECEVPMTEEWRKNMFYASLNNLLAHPETYRDSWDDEDLILEAYSEIARLSQ